MKEDFIFGIVIGIMSAAIATISVSAIHRNELRSVGIERIESCHNVHSNWAEIVWTSTVRGR